MTVRTYWKCIKTTVHICGILVYQNRSYGFIIQLPVSQQKFKKFKKKNLVRKALHSSTSNWFLFNQLVNLTSTKHSIHGFIWFDSLMVTHRCIETSKYKNCIQILKINWKQVEILPTDCQYLLKVNQINSLYSVIHLKIFLCQILNGIAGDKRGQIELY
jgi:hypothetical protein